MTVGAAAWLGVDAIRARRSVEAAAASVGVLKELAVSGDLAGMDAWLETFQDHTRNARRGTTGPHWWLAARLPGVGPTVDAVQAVTVVVDDLATEALPALGEAASLVDPAALAPQDGRIDLQPLLDVAPVVGVAHGAVEAALDRLERIDTHRIDARVAGPVEDLRTKVADLERVTATAARAVRLLPPMLGSAGERRYLLLAQNNAELRSLGGFVGAAIELSADEGRIEIVRQQAGGEMRFRDPPVSLTREELALYDSRMARYLGNVTMTPDFPRAAELARAMWAADVGSQVDGVLVVDPLVLQKLLVATGPVTTSAGLRLTASTAGDVLLNEVYRKIESPQAQDKIFADAAAEVFDALTSGDAEPAAVVHALAQAARERRLLVWSADAGEQELLAGTILSGELRGHIGTSPVIGVYLNDASGAKMSYYLDYDVSVEQVACLPDARREFQAEIKVRSTAPTDVVAMPPYLTGGGVYIPVGAIWTNVAFYAPTGGRILDVWVDGEPAGSGTFTHDGLAAAVRTVRLSPGASQTLTVRITSGANQESPIHARVTPGAGPPKVRISDPTCHG